MEQLLPFDHVGPDFRDNHGRTHLPYAAQGRLAELVHLLISTKRVDYYFKVNEGRTPFD